MKKHTYFEPPVGGELSVLQAVLSEHSLGYTPDHVTYMDGNLAAPVTMWIMNTADFLRYVQPLGLLPQSSFFQVSECKRAYTDLVCMFGSTEVYRQSLGCMTQVSSIELDEYSGYMRTRDGSLYQPKECNYKDPDPDRWAAQAAANVQRQTAQTVSKRWAFAACVAVFLLVIGLATHLEAEQVTTGCADLMPIDNVHSVLREVHGESVLETQQGADGHVVEMWSNSDTGTYTILRYMGNGTVCVLGYGTAESLKATPV